VQSLGPIISTEGFHTNCKCACHNMWEQIPTSFYIITVLASVPEHFHGTIQSILNINFKTVELTLTMEWNSTFWKSNQVEEPLVGTDTIQQTMGRMTRNGEK